MVRYVRGTIEKGFTLELAVRGYSSDKARPNTIWRISRRRTSMALPRWLTQPRKAAVASSLIVAPVVLGASAVAARHMPQFASWLSAVG